MFGLCIRDERSKMRAAGPAVYILMLAILRFRLFVVCTPSEVYGEA
jgi:hypothetical protein